METLFIAFFSCIGSECGYYARFWTRLTSEIVKILKIIIDFRSRCPIVGADQGIVPQIGNKKQKTYGKD